MHDQSIFPGTQTRCHAADLLVEGRLIFAAAGAGLNQAVDLQGDGPLRIVCGAVLVRATTPTHITVNASTLPAITAALRE